MPSLGFALVGCGDIAQRNATSLQQASGTHLARVVDIDPDAVTKMAQQFDVPSSLSLDEADAKVTPLLSSINWVYISLLLLNTDNLGLASVPKDTFRILLRMRNFLSVVDNPIVLIIKLIYLLFFLIVLLRI